MSPSSECSLIRHLFGQPAPYTANVSPEPAFIMTGDNDAQALQGENHSVNCLAWVLTGTANYVF